jgi:hypothetical protein
VTRRTGRDWTDAGAENTDPARRGAASSLVWWGHDECAVLGAGRRRKRRPGVGCGTSERPRFPARNPAPSLRRLAGPPPRTTFSSWALGPATTVVSPRAFWARSGKLSRHLGTQAGPSVPGHGLLYAAPLMPSPGHGARTLP